MKNYPPTRGPLVCAAAALAALAGVAVAQPEVAAPAAQAAPVAAGSHLVTSVTIRYVRPHPDLPDPTVLLGVPVELVETPEGWAAARDGERPTTRILADLVSGPGARFTDTGLAAIAPAVFRRFKTLGFVGTYVTPIADQFRVEDGRVVDARAAGDTSLILEVTTGVVTQVRTVGVGERVPPGESVNNPVHARILEHSPVQAFHEGDGERHDLLRRTAIDEYIARLNRQPGRRVDAAVSAPGDQPGGVTLDYMVTENRPWMLFAQVSNTGSGSTDAFREHVGFIHNDLTRADDILTVGYQTANFNDVHQLYASYDRPLLGSDRVRWKLNASYYRYLASDVGLPGLDFKGEGWQAGAQLAWNFFQRGDFFVDALAGVRFEHVRVDNQPAGTLGETDFLIPRLALRAERHRDESRTDAEVGLEWNLPGLAGTDDTLDALGRTDADDSFAIVRAELSQSLYLDGLLDGGSGAEGNRRHEMLLSARAQHALGARLVPNEQMVAGGLYTVRGYPEAKVAGDNVAMATLEYRFHVAKAIAPSVEPGTFLGEPFRWKPQYAYGPTDWDLVLKAFVDAAWVTDTDPIAGVERSSTLVGAGVGAELSLTRRLTLRADLGVACRELNDAAGGHSVDAGHTELHVVLTVIY